MLIINQDHDEKFNLSTKDIITTSHDAEINGQKVFFGWNMYGRTSKCRALLGTFETPEFCNMVLKRIARAEAEEDEYYSIPEEPDDDIMFDWYNMEDMWARMESAIDYTAIPRLTDRREVEPFGLAVRAEYIIHENPLLSGMD